ncbi:MAG: SpoIIE family protein phosphatase, partial [Acidobacteria bacterium]|nr:SpoIIE family protein phosphatase [Acidobacteriota bacterium]
MQLIMTTGDWLTPEDLEVARQVQARLLPQGTPRLSTLDCGGFCLPARCVGGDFYDFLDLGPERVGLVLGDVSGKGVSAALMMASLQALLRSHCYKAVDDVRTPLRSVNRLFY